ncbi:hypothetical protein AVEN_249582-1 [Araneus ventricosus]|uniref:Uncharacterized protein n=1 Tax=Araneus ventricosus TaxID=182803 RepID=A0A4Y2MC13_ARAVE|nr:hypothetical protein AVEN_249582-1 [Araneus ventricosus]
MSALASHWLDPSRDTCKVFFIFIFLLTRLLASWWRLERRYLGVGLTNGWLETVCDGSMRDKLDPSGAHLLQVRRDSRPQGTLVSCLLPVFLFLSFCFFLPSLEARGGSSP